ncbi:monooxygenase [Stachybotrys elegans]|uniref:Monooxygenase n=1 Tax=Stachybotrys elegans TaxID=80388 RepID=A0A8K0SMU2_9HYPO|nr:monooxygenase [Stachybotrys elegans]
MLKATDALPSSQSINGRQANCTTPRLRKSWDDATPSERAAYIDAALCLTTKPSRLGHASTTLHDDFAWVHNQLDREIHGVAAFLPWHRLFVHVYETALKTECGYTGTAMYWDWVKDSGAPASASVWDPDTGFGGDGVSPDGSPFTWCVQDGPFAGLQLAYWNGDFHPHCLQRSFQPAHPEAGLQEMIGYAYDEEIIAGVFTHTEYVEFRPRLEGTPHGAVHAGIAGGLGDMGPLTSPNDPIFFLHHTMVDQLWWKWQQEDPSRVFDYEGAGATLDDTMRLLGLGEDRTVRDFMDAGNDELCYTY